jgi:hypothetical protein
MGTPFALVEAGHANRSPYLIRFSMLTDYSSAVERL